MYMKISKLTIAFVILAACMLTGCSASRWASVESGEYDVFRGWVAHEIVAAREIETLVVDRDNAQLVFIATDGTEIAASFTPRDRADWSSGCPTNLGATYMEVLDIEADVLTIDSIEFRHPILVRNCPPEPVELVLREDESMNTGGGSACSLEKCILFRAGGEEQLELTGPAGPTPLPRSLKGYELYSWRAGGAWNFTLIAGTNRVKSYAEITAETGAAGSKITVQGVERLFESLDQLPSDTDVVWLGPRALAERGVLPRDLALPPEAMIADVQEHCWEIGIALEIAR